MNRNSMALTTDWQPDNKFWILHFWLPLAFAGVSIYALQHSNLDLWVADKWYALEGHQWAWKNSFVSYDLIHHYGKQGIIAFGILLLILIVSSHFQKGLRLWRIPMTYLYIKAFTCARPALARACKS